MSSSAVEIASSNMKAGEGLASEDMVKEANVVASIEVQGNEESSKGSRHSSRLRKPSRKVVEESQKTEDKAMANSEKFVQSSIEEPEETTGNEEEFCICRKGDDGKPMVLCSNCNEWYVDHDNINVNFRCIRNTNTIPLSSSNRFHFKCVGLTKKVAESLTEFSCPSCITVKNADEKIELTKSVSSASPKRKLEEDDVVTKKARSQAPTLSPTRAQSATSSNVSPKESASSTAQPNRKLSTSSSSNAKPNTSSASAVQRSRSNVLRKNAEDQLTAIFNEIMAEAIKDAQDAGKKSQEYAHKFEESLYEMTNESAVNVNLRIAGKAYRDRLRSFLFNLRDKTNKTLRSKIANGKISASELSSMSSEELANDTRREEVERRKKESLEQSILKKESAPLRKLTHKGEIDIEYENRLVEDHVHSSISISNRATDEEDIRKSSPDQDSKDVDEDSKLRSVKSSSSAELHRRASQSVQSPTLPFDFSNVWQGEKSPDENEEMVEAGSGKQKDEVKENSSIGPTDAYAEVHDGVQEDEKADEFIDNFLGMPEDGDERTQEKQMSGQETESQDTLPMIGWKGSIHMPDEGFFTCAVRQIAGRDLTAQDWTNLFPSPFSLIEGRLPSGSAIPYLLESRIAPRTELVALIAEPEFISESMPEANKIVDEEGNKSSFDHLVNYFTGKDRYGVLQPLRSARRRAVKDFYMAALPKDQPIPEWLALLSPQYLSNAKSASRERNLFLLVGVLFRQDIITQGPSKSGQQASSSTTPREGGGYTPDQTNSSGYGGGSTTLQDLLKAVGGNARSNNTPPNPVGGGTPTALGGSQATILQSGIIPPSSVQALSELPKPQLEDVLTKNPNLVEDLLRTLGKTSSTPTSSIPASIGPPGPPPLRPSFAGFGSTPTYGQSGQQQGYGSSTYPQQTEAYHYQYSNHQNQHYTNQNNAQGYQQYGYGQNVNQAPQQYDQTPSGVSGRYNGDRREYSNNQNYQRGYQSGGGRY